MSFILVLHDFYLFFFPYGKFYLLQNLLLAILASGFLTLGVLPDSMMSVFTCLLLKTRQASLTL